VKKELNTQDADQHHHNVKDIKDRTKDKMPYRVDPKNKKCVQVKKSGKWQRKGCTDGPVKKYLAALYANTEDITESTENQFDWVENIIGKISFGSFKKHLKEGDKVILSGEITDDMGETLCSVEEEPFSVEEITANNSIYLKWVRDVSERPADWESITNDFDVIYFTKDTEEYDNNLIVTIFKDINLNENTENSEWWEDLSKRLIKFGTIRKFLQEGDIINLTGDLTDSDGYVEVTLNEEPFIVVRNVNEGKMVILRFLNFSKPDDLPKGWDVVANLDNGDVSFRNFTKKYDDELIVTFNDDNRLNENVEDSEWYMNIINDPGSILNFKGKEIMIDVRGLSFEEKLRLLKIITPYVNESNIERNQNSSEQDDWAPECLLRSTRVMSISLHCGTEETDYIPESGNFCCLTYSYEHEETTPKELILPLNARDILNSYHLNESDFDWINDLLEKKPPFPPPNTPVTMDNWDQYKTVKVIRGKDWMWGNQDNNGFGKIVDKPYKDGTNIWIPVKWDNEHRNSYRIGYNDFDLYFYTPEIWIKNPYEKKLNESNRHKGFVNLIKEGKYDKITGLAVKDIMRILNTITEKDKKKSKYSFSLPNDLKLKNQNEYYQEGLQFGINLEIYYVDNLNSGEDFEVVSVITKDRYVRDYEQENNILIKIKIKKGTDKTIFNRIYYKLNEDIRHEIEHFKQSGPNLIPGRPKPKDSKYFKTTFGHHKNLAEIPALVHGFYRRAKKEKKPLDVVMIEDLDKEVTRGDINLKQKEKLLQIWIDYAKQNIPTAIYKNF
jgi:hypothetical protein